MSVNEGHVLILQTLANILQFFFNDMTVVNFEDLSNLKDTYRVPDTSQRITIALTSVFSFG